jgi:hypothetical protein
MARLVGKLRGRGTRTDQSESAAEPEDALASETHRSGAEDADDVVARADVEGADVGLDQSS